MTHSPDTFVRWAHAVANSILPPMHSDHDDIVQEGLIEIARVLAAKPDVSATYLTKTAKDRMREAAYDGKLTGLPDRRLRSGPPPAHTDSLTALLDEAPDLVEGSRRGIRYTEPGYARVEWEGHRPRIVEALAALDDRDRDYVVDRFYRGHRDAEIARASGRTTKAVANRWASSIRPRLAASLPELADAA